MNLKARHRGPLFVCKTGGREINRKEGHRGAAQTDASPCRSPSDWLPPPSPLSETRTSCQAAASSGGWRILTTADICRRTGGRKVRLLKIGGGRL